MRYSLGIISRYKVQYPLLSLYYEYFVHVIDKKLCECVDVSNILK